MLNLCVLYPHNTHIHIHTNNIEGKYYKIFDSKGSKKSIKNREETMLNLVDSNPTVRDMFVSFQTHLLKLKLPMKWRLWMAKRSR